MNLGWIFIYKTSLIRYNLREWTYLVCFCLIIVVPDIGIRSIFHNKIPGLRNVIDDSTTILYYYFLNIFYFFLDRYHILIIIFQFLIDEAFFNYSKGFSIENILSHFVISTFLLLFLMDQSVCSRWNRNEVFFTEFLFLHKTLSQPLDCDNLDVEQWADSMNSCSLFLFIERCEASSV